MKIRKEKYPFTVTIEDKVSKSTFKNYQAISICFTTRAKDWTEQNKVYDKTYFNFFDESDLLTLSNLCESAYRQLANQRQHEREEQFQAKVQ